MALRVGLNLVHLVPAVTGGSELYARRLIPALIDARSDMRLVLFAAPIAVRSLREASWGSDVELVELDVDPRSRVKRVLAEQILLPRAARKAGVDLLHNIFTTAPAVPRMPQVTTILDVIYKRYPETHAGLLRYGMAVLVPLAARRSTRIVAISEAAKADIAEFLGVPPEGIDVTLLGPALATAAEPVSEDEIRRRFELGTAQLVLTVSAKRPHKNLKRLIEAMTQLPDAVLVVPGYPTAFEAELRAVAAASPVGGRIRFTGWVDDATLDGLYRAATCFVFPSLAEGFGLPVLDALVRGVPVACSNASSIPEVAGEAAVYFDPVCTEAIADAVGQLLQDADLRARLSKAGRERARLFSWAKTAEGTLESYDRALAASKAAIS